MLSNHQLPLPKNQFITPTVNPNDRPESNNQLKINWTIIKFLLICLSFDLLFFSYFWLLDRSLLSPWCE
ncbi:hypothetical protein [Dactylococcopsis salina]|uniref:Uncharacterized protein n=1 Tax=Dactylococcopsis salina (strain PCC 8305) TaxID=13035 RepID=K9YZ60_DACS8|nr:hypothetical protein [Dactylococcopsis salina]AFZ51772.1 hypothetical protein Dacsa_3253 [Dactylococcopsis salina PCC 8305]